MPRTPEAAVQWLVALTSRGPPGKVLHWAGPMLAGTAWHSLRTAQRI
jgi:hypothetical protein